MTTTSDLPSLANECFFIAPIGEEGSAERDRSDGVLEFVVAPAAEAHGLVVVRADRIEEPGQITRQVIEHVVGARAAVVDLTGANPNVYYEMAVRHTAELATVLIADINEALPFDIAQMRTIFFDHTNLKSASNCRTQIERHLAEALAGAVESPVTSSVDVSSLRQGGEEQRTLADLVERVETLSTLMSRDERGVGLAAKTVGDQAMALEALVREEVRRREATSKMTPNVGPALVRLADLFDQFAGLVDGQTEDADTLTCLGDIRALLDFALLTVPASDFTNMGRHPPNIPLEHRES